MGGFWERNGGILGAYLVLAVGFWVLVLIVLPQLSMLDYSFRFNLPPADVGTGKDVYTLSNYAFFIYGAPGNPEPFNVVDLSVFVRTLGPDGPVVELNGIR